MTAPGDIGPLAMVLQQGKVLECSLFLLRKSKLTRCDGNYKNTIRIALIQWSPFHDALPGATQVEEKAESMLSRLVKASKHNPVRSRQPVVGRARPQRGAGYPPSPSTDPKVVVQNNAFCGRLRNRRFLFRHTAGANFFVPPYVSVLKILSNLGRISKQLKSTKKDFDPDPAFGSDLG